LNGDADTAGEEPPAKRTKVESSHSKAFKEVDGVILVDDDEADVIVIDD